MLIYLVPRFEEGELVALNLEIEESLGEDLEVRIRGGLSRSPFIFYLEELISDYNRGRWKPADELVNHALKDNISKLPWAERIYRELLKVPFGDRITYGELARRAGSYPRAVGLAMKLNKFPIIIPCHRVVSRTGLGGYSQGEEIKRALLNWESSFKERSLAGRVGYK